MIFDEQRLLIIPATSPSIPIIHMPESGWMSSWWDKYLAPGDIRAQRQPAPAQPQDNEVNPTPSASTPVFRVDAATRSRRQNGMLFGGIAFLALSMFVTKRATSRKYLSAYPKFVKKQPGGKDAKLDVPTFTQSNVAPQQEGGLDAAEALFLATLGTLSVFMAGTGVAMKVYDIADIEDMRDFVRRNMGEDIYAGDSAADKEIENWMAEVLARKDGTGDLQTSIVEKMAELAELDKKTQLAKTEELLQKKRLALELAARKQG